MAAQVDLLRAKVGEEILRESLDRFIKERKKKKKRELSASAEKDAKRLKLHHQDQDQHRSQEPHQLQQNPKPHNNFSAGKHVLHSHKHQHHQHQHHHTKKDVQPALQPPPPRKVPAERLQQLQKKRALPPEPPALFTFTPLKGVKAKPQDFKPQDFKEKDPKLKLKKENTEANVKHAELNKKKGEFFLFIIVSIIMQKTNKKGMKCS